MMPVWIWTIAASMLALACGFVLGKACFQVLQRRSVAATMLASNGHDRMILRLQGGIAPLRGLSDRLMAAFPLLDDAFDGASILLAEQSLSFTKTALCSLLIGVSICMALVGCAVSGSPTFGIAAGCIVFSGVIAYIRNKGEKRSASMREEVPEALRSLSMSFRSGNSLSQTLSNSAKESNGYLGHLFSIAADRLEMGATTTEALSVMRGNARVPELSFVAVALDVQHQSGGSIAPVLESAMESVEGELKLARALKVQTAQAKLSASIVTVMPFVLVALFSLMSPDFLSPFFSSLLGMALLAMALAMQVTGVLIVRRMLKVEVI